MEDSVSVGGATVDLDAADVVRVRPSAADPSGTPLSEADLAGQIKAAQARSILGSTTITLLANTFIAATTAGILWLSNPDSGVLVWFGVVFAVNMIRLFISHRLRKADAAAQAPERTLTILGLAAFVAGLLWAMPPFFGGGVSDQGTNAYVIFIICGISAGAIIQSSAYSRTAKAFAIPPIGATVLCLLAEATVLTSIIAIDVLLLMTMMLRSSRMAEASFVASQRDRIEAVQLAASLAAANIEISHSNRQLESLANGDPLTGLANRAAFNQHLRGLIEKPTSEAGEIALIVIDLDRFKSINDTMGHGAGDRVLVEFARRLSALAGPQDLVSRMGGDEFAVILEGRDVVSRATTLGDAIMTLTACPVMIGDRPITIGSSAGLAVYPDHGTTAQDLFASADIALYAAKDQGRRCICVFNPDIRRRLERQKQIELGLEQAILSGQVYAVFQPQVDLSSRAITGFEALVRWTHPTLGVISPPEIVQAAHATHAAATLTRHVARAAAALAADLPRLGLGGVCVAVNVSPRELSSYPVSALLLDVAREAGIAPSCLEVEITEEAILDTETAGEELARLEQAGFRLAVDDFGMGHSSLAYLIDLRIDRLKIDRSFIHGIAVSRQNQALISALVGIGHALEIEVVVEGVETAADAEVLRMLGCRLAQGYLFGRPMPVADLSGWIAAHTRLPQVSALSA